MFQKYIPTFSATEEEEVYKRLDPANGKACNNNILWGNSLNQVYSGNYHGFSFKRSNLISSRFDDAHFDHCNFTGSTLNDVHFSESCSFTSVNFLRSFISNCSFSSKEQLHVLNFSSCTLSNVIFNNIVLRGSYFNSAKILNCYFDNSKIMSTSFDNCTIMNSSFRNCNMRNLNLEFSTFINNDLDGAQFSFYQLPYIIGIFKHPEKLEKIKIGCGKNKTISFLDYTQRLNDSIIYFTSKKQFLPLANLYYLNEQIDIAKNSIFVGIDEALLRNDYTTIKFLIKLALNLELLTYTEINQIMKEIDRYLNNLKDDINISYYLLQSYEIQNDIQNMFNKSILSFKIDTTFNNEQFGEASELCQDIDNILSSINRDVNYSFNLSHNSPISIVLSVVGAVADLMGISSLIYNFIEKRLNKKRKVNNNVKETINRYNQLFLSSIDENIDNLKTILSKTKKDKQGEIIDDFRLKLLTSIGEAVDINLALVMPENN
ncbi:MAG: pentapeptide repeat-containing protein [Malacoplasma sp.]|nr:pentapeptide repeat-containing protein [Malacoplasma sp.]